MNIHLSVNTDRLAGLLMHHVAAWSSNSLLQLAVMK